MTEPSHESAPHQEALFEIPSQEQRESAWEEIGSREDEKALTHDQKMALGRQGLGGAGVVKYFEDHTFYENQGIGAPGSDEDRVRTQTHARAYTQATLDRHWRESIQAQEAGDAYTAARAKARVDAINARQLSMGHDPIGPSFDALPEAQQRDQ